MPKELRKIIVHEPTLAGPSLSRNPSNSLLILLMLRQIFLVGSSLYMLYVMGMELFAGVPQLDTTSALPLCILGAGLLNSLSSIPM